MSHTKTQNPAIFFGYPRRKLSDRGLHEMREVTISAPPEVLRELAAFINEVADKIENGELDRISHVNASFKINNWETRFGDNDLIVSLARKVEGGGFEKFTKGVDARIPNYKTR